MFASWKKRRKKKYRRHFLTRAWFPRRPMNELHSRSIPFGGDAWSIRREITLRRKRKMISRARSSHKTPLFFLTNEKSRSYKFELPFLFLSIRSKIQRFFLINVLQSLIGKIVLSQWLDLNTAYVTGDSKNGKNLIHLWQRLYEKVVTGREGQRRRKRVVLYLASGIFDFYFLREKWRRRADQGS